MLSCFRRITATHTPDVVLSNSSAESFLNYIGDQCVDVVFTSPPYFDTELYDGNNASQSCVVYSDYGDWFNNWLVHCLRESARTLKPGGKLIINIANCFPYFIADDTRRYLQSTDLVVEEWSIFLSSHKFEPLLVASK